MVAKTHLAKFLAMTKKLLVVWMVAKFLVCQWFFANSWETKSSTKVLASQIFGTEPNMPDIMSD
jgi:hypothetical protein